MKLALVVLSVAAIASVYSVAEIVELGVDAAVASGVDCDSVRASLPSICKIMPEQCATIKNKLRTSCAAQPEELIQTAAKQAPRPTLMPMMTWARPAARVAVEAAAASFPPP